MEDGAAKERRGVKYKKALREPGTTHANVKVFFLTEKFRYMKLRLFCMTLLEI